MPRGFYVCNGRFWDCKDNGGNVGVYKVKWQFYLDIVEQTVSSNRLVHPAST